MSQVQIDDILVGLDNGELAMESALRDIFNFFNDRLRNASQSLRNLSPIDKITEDKRRFLQVIDKVDYMTIESLLVQTPEGFKGTYLDYLSRTRQVMEAVHRVEKEVLDPLEKLVSDIIATEQARSRYDDGVHRKLKLFSTETKQASQALADMFTASLRYKSTYGEVVRRNSDWVMIFTEIEKIISASFLDVNRLIKKTDDLAKLFDTVSGMATNKNLAMYNGRQRQLLSDLAMMAADQVALVSVAFYHSRAASSSISTTVKQIIKQYG